jgi:hypothetical protein
VRVAAIWPDAGPVRVDRSEIDPRPRRGRWARWHRPARRLPYSRDRAEHPAARVPRPAAGAERLRGARAESGDLGAAPRLPPRARASARAAAGCSRRPRPDPSALTSDEMGRLRELLAAAERVRVVYGPLCAGSRCAPAVVIVEGLEPVAIWDPARFRIGLQRRALAPGVEPRPALAHELAHECEMAAKAEVVRSSRSDGGSRTRTRSRSCTHRCRVLSTASSPCAGTTRRAGSPRSSRRRSRALPLVPGTVAIGGGTGRAARSVFGGP